MSDEIYDYVTSVFQDQTGWVVGGLMDQAGSRGQLRIQKDFFYPDAIEDLVEWADSHRQQDAYISPLVYGDMRKKDGHIRRIPENAISSHVVYQDSDRCTPDKFRMRPSIHVESSAGRYQDYWLLTEAVPAERAANASRRIAVAHRADGSDPSSWSANKFLRIPTTTNTRHGFPEQVTGQITGVVYDIEEIESTYADVDFEEKPVMRLPEDMSFDDVQDLPEYTTAMDKLSHNFKMSLLTDVPAPNQDRSTLRYRLLCDLFREPNLTFEDVIALAWHAPSSAKWRDDPRNLRGLIGEALKAQADVAFRAGIVESVSAEDTNVGILEKDRPTVCMITDEERALCLTERDFIKKYCRWAQDKLGAAYNAPYARMNAWLALAGAFSDLGINPENGDNLNLFGMALGGSGSGKSTSRRLWDRLMQEIFDADPGWMLGSNASPEALHEKLIERDGHVSFFSADEAHGWFKRVNGNQWANGTYEALAEYYDGDVPPMLRSSAGRRETSGKRAKSFFNIHMMGTVKGEMALPSVLNTSMFFSGFLPRFIWYLGEEKEITPEAVRATNGDGEFASQGFEAQARQWAAEFKNARKVLRARTGKMRIPMNLTQAALDRLSKFSWDAREQAQKRAEWEILEPCMIRLPQNARRAASLLALEEGLAEVELRHVVLALEAAEEWLANLFFVAEQVSASAWARETDEIEMFILAKGGECRREIVMRKFSSRHPRDLLLQIESLQAQGRIAEIGDNQGRKILRMVTDANEKE